MKLSPLSFALFLLSTAAGSGAVSGETDHRARTSSKTFTPYRIAYDDLVRSLKEPKSGASSSTFLLDVLEDSNGMISVTGLPNDFQSAKRTVLTNLHSCLLEQQKKQGESKDEEGSIAAVSEQAFPDGTIRRTFATAKTAKDGQMPMMMNDPQEDSPACRSFQKNLDKFRRITDDATAAFSKVLSKEIDPHLNKSSPLLMNVKSSPSYDSVEDLVTNGEVLEHFHSYQKIGGGGVGEEYNDVDIEDHQQTIDLHADQGFFIAFTPGMMVRKNAAGGEDVTIDSSDGFYILEDDEDDGNQGNTRRAMTEVKFDADKDELVFMLGDGVNQYVNPSMTTGGNGRNLRATPHAVSLRFHDESVARVWYGRMVLPPDDALVPKQATLSYGDLRRRLKGEEGNVAVLPAGVGCSSPTARALAAPTHDEPGSCSDDQLFCWARCTDLEPFNITSAQTCEEQGLELKCINPRGQYTPGDRHGDFYPACTDTTEEVTPYPEIPQQNPEVCTSEAWTEFLSGGNNAYDHTFDLSNDMNNGTAFQWSVVDEEKGIVKGRLVFGDVFGWLGFGFANPGGKHNGMNGGNILLALPGGDYTAEYGLVVPGMTDAGSGEISTDVAKLRSVEITETTNPEGSTVKMYQISNGGSAFRHWDKPTGELDGTDTSEASVVVVTDCFTSMEFVTDNINGETFNVSGTNEMIWAGNSEDYYVGYHGRGNRARFTLNWMNGTGYFYGADEESEYGSEHEEGDEGHDDHSDHDHSDHEESAGHYYRNLHQLLVAAAAAVTGTLYLN